MITPRAHSVEQGRADFDELDLRLDDHVCLGDDDHAHVRVWRAPDDSPVVHIGLDVRASVEHARLLGENLRVPDGAHIFANAPEYEEGFDRTLDAALPADAKLTLIEHVPDPPEVANVPWPPEAAPVVVQLVVDEDDFGLLTGDSYPFGSDYTNLEMIDSWHPNVGRGYDHEGEWERVYIVPGRGGWSGVMMATAFLQGHRQAYEVCCDPVGDWWLLTNFKTAEVRRSEQQQQVRERLKREAAEASDDPLLRAFHMPSAEKKGEDQSDGE
ncbi:hypothetical protein [Streptomyces sp. NPDC057002]|uniref:hypothetical protein n=1 Tax=Streptomyces sp. NPDC057002 TaxID=3345992 RepID=UPI00362F5285